MLVTPSHLIGDDLVVFSEKAFASSHSIVPVYVHRPASVVEVNGGSYGSQLITTQVFDPTLYDWFEQTLHNLDLFLELDFVFTQHRSDSIISIFLDTEINIGGSGLTLGLAIPNHTSSHFHLGSYSWEIILNTPQFSDISFLKYAILHEFGHSLGLEHPFDYSDSDGIGNIFADPDGSITVMSYTEPLDGWPTAYSYLDHAALASIWGLESDHSGRWLFANSDGTQSSLSTFDANLRLASNRPGELFLGLDRPSLSLDLVSLCASPYGIWEIPLDLLTPPSGYTYSASRLFYNSTHIVPSLDFQLPYNQALSSLFSVPTFDVDDLDNDPLTNQFVDIRSFVVPSSPQSLPIIRFEQSDFSGLLTTPLNLSFDSLTGHYSLEPLRLDLFPARPFFSLDVDSDGHYTAFGDGLMIIRHMFGNSFIGEDLISKAINPTSPLLVEQGLSFIDAAAHIRHHIQTGIDSLALDVDRDGVVTPFGDGLMIVRYLLGSSFSGDSLISKAISPDSSFIDSLQDLSNSAPSHALAEMVAFNIDALMH